MSAFIRIGSFSLLIPQNVLTSICLSGLLTAFNRTGSVTNSIPFSGIKNHSFSSDIEIDSNKTI